MIVDVRKYRIKAGCMAAHLAIYEKHGLKPQTRHLGQPLAYLYTESGEINTIVHMWAFEDATDRMHKRAAMQADPEWQAFLKISAEAGNLLRQENRIMTPAPFFQLQR